MDTLSAGCSTRSEPACIPATTGGHGEPTEIGRILSASFDGWFRGGTWSSVVGTYTTESSTSIPKMQRRKVVVLRVSSVECVAYVSLKRGRGVHFVRIHAKEGCEFPPLNADREAALSKIGGFLRSLFTLSPHESLMTWTEAYADFKSGLSRCERGVCDLEAWITATRGREPEVSMTPVAQKICEIFDDSGDVVVPFTAPQKRAAVFFLTLLRDMPEQTVVWSPQIRDDLYDACGLHDPNDKRAVITKLLDHGMLSIGRSGAGEKSARTYTLTDAGRDWLRQQSHVTIPPLAMVLPDVSVDLLIALLGDGGSSFTHVAVKDFNARIGKGPLYGKHILPLCAWGFVSRKGEEYRVLRSSEIDTILNSEIADPHGSGDQTSAPSKGADDESSDDDSVSVAVDLLTDQIASLQAQLDSIEQEIATLQAQRGGLSAQIESLSETIRQRHSEALDEFRQLAEAKGLSMRRLAQMMLESGE